jgi:hypothetical protein
MERLQLMTVPEHQHGALVGVGKLQHLVLDLACELVAQHVPAQSREVPAVLIEFGENFPKLRPPSPVAGRASRQAQDAPVITPVELRHRCYSVAGASRGSRVEYDAQAAMVDV